MPARLEDLKQGLAVRGVVTGETVTVVQVEWHGIDVVTLTYRREGGNVGSELLYREQEVRLDVDAGEGRAWAFDADGGLFRLVAEARRIRLAYLFDPRLAEVSGLAREGVRFPLV